MNKATPGPFKEVTIGPTPHGGVYKVAYYFNSRYASVTKEEATRVIIHEYDEKDRSIFREYISCGPDDEAEYAAMEALENADKPQPMVQRKRLIEQRPRREERPVKAASDEKTKTQERKRRDERPRAAVPKDQEEKRRQEHRDDRPRREGQKRAPNKEGPKTQTTEQKTKPAQSADSARRPDEAKRRRRRPPRKPSDPNKAPRLEKKPE